MSETNSWSDEIACPHCGHKIRDLWEYDSDATEIECGECEVQIVLVRHVSVLYTATVSPKVKA